MFNDHTEQFKKIAYQLGDNWRYNAVLSSSPNARGHYFSNGAGLFLYIRSCYGESLPQWSLSYLHPKHKHHINFVTIGCSLEKSNSAIVSDLQNRLLSHSAECYKKLSEETEIALQENQSSELSGFMLSAMKKVLSMTPFYDYRFTDAWVISDKAGNEKARLRKWKHEHNFRLSIDSVSPEQVIKIMQIVEG